MDYEKSSYSIRKKLITKKYRNVLEIGAGWHPHLNYIKHEYDLYHVLETNNETKKIYKGVDKVKHITYSGKSCLSKQLL